MSLYDTRFFFEHYYTRNKDIAEKTKMELKSKGRKYISVITIHEIYKLTLEKEGKEVAKIRINLLKKDFNVIPVDEKVAKVSAELRHKYRIPMADSIIAATAKILRLICITDDPHIKQIREIRTRWI